ncbi:MAG: hypothetical protein FIA93_10705 [Deltaproteobacteria bacterium]|nr:hypothetical protein [Deltaproteobacteria bacterium]PWB64782.1 MAG: hypothetical protein C3F14_06215 [Deltaproteobacteria bacterium]
MAHPSSRSCFPLCAAAALLVFLVSLSGCGNNDVGTAQSVATLAGAAGGPGFFDGTGTLVRFSTPSGAAVIGSNVFVADTANHVIRKVDTATGAVTTLAGVFGIPGTADGTGAAARFNSPAGIAAVGSILYVCDTGNHTLRTIVSTSGVVTTLAGAPGSSGAVDNNVPANVRFSSPRGIAALGTDLFVADTGNHKIRRVTAAGATTTYAGSGSPGITDNTGTGASFRSPEGVAVIATDVYVADTGNHTIRKITPNGAVGDVTTFAGAVTVAGFVDNVAGLLARFSSPSALAANGNDLYVADTGNHVIRKIDPSAFVTSLAGTPGSAGSGNSVPGPAQFNGPKGIGTLGTGSSSIFVADTGNGTIRRVDFSGVVTTVAGNPPKTGAIDGTGTAARFNAPAGAAVIGDDVYVADTGNGAIRKITSSGEVTTVPGTVGPFASPAGIAAIGATLYICDNVSHTISSVPAAGGTVTVVAGLAGSAGSADGAGTAARFSAPRGIATDGTNLFVADTGNHTIRRVTPSGDVTTLAGLAGNPGTADGSGSGINPTARFNGPQGIAVVTASLATTLYAADTGNHAIRRVTGVGSPNVNVTTFAGTAGTAGFANGSGESALFSSPSGITAVDGVLYAADTGNHVVRRIETTRNVTTFVGAPDKATTRDGDAPQALLNAPAGMAGLPGTIFFTDRNENVVRKILF